MIDTDSLSEDECRSVLKMMGWTEEDRDKRMPLFGSLKAELKFQLLMRKHKEKLIGNHLKT